MKYIQSLEYQSYFNYYEYNDESGYRKKINEKFRTVYIHWCSIR